MVIPIGAKKSSDKTAFFHYKNSQQKIKVAMNFFYLIKRIHQNSIANSVLNDEQRIPLKSGTRAGASLCWRYKLAVARLEKKASRWTKAKQHLQYFYATFCD